MKNDEKPRRQASGRRPAGHSALNDVHAPAEALFGYRLWQIHYAWHRHIERQLNAIKLTHLQYVLLAATYHLLQDDQVPSQSRLAQYTKLEKMMVSKNLRLLEDRGYVTRKRHPNNRRANRIDLTARGRAILRHAFDAAVAAHAIFFHSAKVDWHKFDDMLRLLMGVDENPPQEKLKRSA